MLKLGLKLRLDKMQLVQEKPSNHNNIFASHLDRED